MAGALALSSGVFAGPVTGCPSAVKNERAFVSSYGSYATRMGGVVAVVHEFLHAFENLSNQRALV